MTSTPLVQATATVTGVRDGVRHFRQQTVRYDSRRIERDFVVAAEGRPAQHRIFVEWRDSSGRPANGLRPMLVTALVVDGTDLCATSQPQTPDELPVPIAGHHVNSHHPAFATGTVVRADAGAGQTAVYYRLGKALVLEEGIRGGWLREYASEADVDAVVAWLTGTPTLVQRAVEAAELESSNWTLLRDDLTDVDVRPYMLGVVGAALEAVEPTMRWLVAEALWSPVPTEP